MYTLGVLRRALLPISVTLLFSCAKRPDYLSRDQSVDELCSDGKVGYSYEIDQKEVKKGEKGIPDDAIKSGCEAPVNAWTDDRDKAAGGARKRAAELRDEGKTILCCKG